MIGLNWKNVPLSAFGLFSLCVAAAGALSSTGPSNMLPKMEKRACKMLMKWLNISGIWLMAIPEFGVILYAVGHINAFPSRNSGSCRVG